MCTSTHQFTKCGQCMNILDEDYPCIFRCKLHKQGRRCEKTTKDESTKDESTKDADADDYGECVKREEERKRKAKENSK
ncbi:unnamed protein product [Fusarium venenatum]|uniref:Uncharacterized protein n=1 Tax=Fusarium venenatum TaxID=56646 RepID=A0A2L2SXP0_9HYPO|nr:uncharacterized protein FVRRES_05925 [Fusarium venenatum]CEI61489.1 unnamed protein product [Fusarium venenatum]